MALLLDMAPGKVQELASDKAPDRAAVPDTALERAAATVQGTELQPVAPGTARGTAQGMALRLAA
jgi:hypothetical protein